MHRICVGFFAAWMLMMGVCRLAAGCDGAARAAAVAAQLRQGYAGKKGPSGHHLTRFAATPKSQPSLRECCCLPQCRTWKTGFATLVLLSLKSMPMSLRPVSACASAPCHSSHVPCLPTQLYNISLRQDILNPQHWNVMARWKYLLLLIALAILIAAVNDILASSSTNFPITRATQTYGMNACRI